MTPTEAFDFWPPLVLHHSPLPDALQDRALSGASGSHQVGAPVAGQSSVSGLALLGNGPGTPPCRQTELLPWISWSKIKHQYLCYVWIVRRLFLN